MIDLQENGPADARPPHRLQVGGHSLAGEVAVHEIPSTPTAVLAAVVSQMSLQIVPLQLLRACRRSRQGSTDPEKGRKQGVSRSVFMVRCPWALLDDSHGADESADCKRERTPRLAGGIRERWAVPGCSPPTSRRDRTRWRRSTPRAIASTTAGSSSWFAFGFTLRACESSGVDSNRRVVSVASPPSALASASARLMVGRLRGWRDTR